MLVTPSNIIQYLYCPRFIWFEHVLKIPQYEERNYKVMRGRNLHIQKLEQNIHYLRKRIGAKKKLMNQYLSNKYLCGIVDEILELSDGTYAPLDYKFAKWNDRLYNTYNTQLYCYAILIEDNFKVKVKKGFVVYTRSKNKLISIDIDQKEKSKVMRYAKSIIEMIVENQHPAKTKYRTKCLTCTYRNICVQ